MRIALTQRELIALRLTLSRMCAPICVCVRVSVYSDVQPARGDGGAQAYDRHVSQPLVPDAPHRGQRSLRAWRGGSSGSDRLQH